MVKWCWWGARVLIEFVITSTMMLFMHLLQGVMEMLLQTWQGFIN
jgi:hypothetical protein